jgi:NitT/TauT family transport system ATP-binding protein
VQNISITNTALPDIVELKDINQTYNNGATKVIDKLTLLVEDKPDQGQFVIILGPSGCGKSTLLRYIAGLQTPTSGEVLIKGKPRSDKDTIGMVFQQYSSFPWLSVLDNVALGLKFKGISEKERKEQAMEMIKIVGLDGQEKKYAQYPSLSGGQLQRVAIARSLLVNNEIILMDEPFGALDTNTRLKMQDFLLQIWHNVHPTIILVTHDISEAVYLGDDIYIMSNAPANIIEHVPTLFGQEKNHDLKRTKAFVDMVYYIEDKMMQIQV